MASDRPRHEVRWCFHTTAMVVPDATEFWPENSSIGYALGWMIDNYRGHRVVQHGGNIDGFSAMVSVMLANWPDVFAGGAIFAGIPFGCATNKKTTDEANNCLKDYTGTNAYLSRTPQEWGDLVRGAAPGVKAAPPRVSIWQGSSDAVVSTSNLTALVRQWTNVNGIEELRGRLDEARSICVLTGSGISAEDLPHVFDRYRKSPDSQGSGLGLAIAHNSYRDQVWMVEDCTKCM